MADPHLMGGVLLKMFAAADHASPLGPSPGGIDAPKALPMPGYVPLLIGCGRPVHLPVYFVFGGSEGTGVRRYDERMCRSVRHHRYAAKTVATGVMPLAARAFVL